MNVLLVGNAGEAGRVIREHLGRSGHDLVCITSHTDALRSVHEETPSLVVLLEVSEDSLDWCRRLRSIDLPVRPVVLMVVPSGQQDRLQDILAAGADDYLIAGADMELLRVKLVFAERQAEDRCDLLQIERELEARVRQQAVVSEMGRRALAGVGAQRVMEFAVYAVSEALRASGSTAIERQGYHGPLVLRAAVGMDRVGSGSVLVDEGPGTLAGAALVNEEVLIVDDLEADERVADHDFFSSLGSASAMAAPIAGESGTHGLLTVHSSKPRAFQQKDAHFLEAVANVLAACIERKRAEDALRDSEARSRAIVETTVDGVITIDEQGVIESFNPAAERIFGWSAAEVIGQKVNVLMPEPYRSDHDAYMDRYHRTGQRKIIGIGREVVGLHRDGSTFPMDLAVSEVQIAGRRIYTGLIRDITERRRLEQEILEASEQERRRIGQDLHDGLGQMLTGIGLICQNLARRLRKDGATAAEDVQEVTDLVREADQYARGLARSLVPVELDEGGLSVALQRLAVNAERLFGVQCVYEETGRSAIDTATVAMNLFRIAQEALSNAVKHGQASRIAIRLATGEDDIRLMIRDDGSGFPEHLGELRGMGVRIMHHRARMIGASLDIRRMTEGGTLVTCTLPRLRRVQGTTRKRTKSSAT